MSTTHAHTAEKISFTSRAGAAASGEIAFPAGAAAAAAKAPGIVLVQEWWGVNDHIRSIMQRLANEGFVVIAPDLYHGTVTKSADEAGKLMNALDWPQALAEIGGAVEALRGHARCNGKVSVMGFCMGGALSFAAACNVPDLAAVVPFYGIPGQADWSKVSAPVLAHFAAKDGWAKPEGARTIQKAITDHGGSMELFVYDADHAFFNDTRPEVFSKESAALAWERSMSFLKAHSSV